MDFYQTVMGRKFFEKDFPNMVKALEGIREELAKISKQLETKNQQESEADKDGEAGM